MAARRRLSLLLLMSVVTLSLICCTVEENGQDSAAPTATVEPMTHTMSPSDIPESEVFTVTESIPAPTACATEPTHIPVLATTASKPPASATIPRETIPMTTEDTITSKLPSPETTVLQTTAAATEAESSSPAITEDWKAMWLSQYDMHSMYTYGGGQRTQSSFTSLVEQMLDNICANGFNTIIVQVRPFGDSMYPSKLYPPSEYVTGNYYAGFSYDPFAIVLNQAHARGLSVHAWINPLRAMETDKIIRIYDSYAIRRWYDDPETCGKYIVEYNGRLYLNPAYEEVRNLIVAGVVEILEMYDVDGIHMDDYFYPTTDESFDTAAYADYTLVGGTLDLLSWRRANLDTLVSSLYSAVKSASPDAIFGISPSGVIDTVYNSHCADVYRWCSEEGFLDYICPQIYFGMEHDTLAFDTVCDRWEAIIKNHRVSLIIGMGLGKALTGEDQWAGTGRYEWTENKDILVRSLAYTDGLKNCVGVSVFCYQYFNHPTTGEDVAGTAEERSTFIPLLKKISWHDDFHVNDPGYGGGDLYT